jgi:hypothetical protein
VNAEESAQVSNVVRTVESNLRPEAVAINFWPRPNPSHFTPEAYVEYGYGQAILYQLTADGFEPLMQPFFTVLSGISYSQGSAPRRVDVIMTGESWSSVPQKVVIGAHGQSVR